MMDWGLVAKIAGGGFGTTIFVLIVLSLIAWGVGWLIQRTAKAPPEDKQNSK